MRSTDDRYAGERRQFDLAMRLINHEARTHIIAGLTGFSQDRIRKLYATYFRHAGRTDIRRQRGKSPSNVRFFVRNARTQGQASTMAYLFGVFRLLTVNRQLEAIRVPFDCSLQFGEQLCDAYECYRSLYRRPALSFERAWSLFEALIERRDAVLADCGHCGNIYVQDTLALDAARCPPCRLRDKGLTRRFVTMADASSRAPA
jgi:hypothetical protein